MIELPYTVLVANSSQPSPGEREPAVCMSSLKMALPPRPTLFDFQGIQITKSFTGNWDNLQNFKARPDDILVATYPKAGTTWVSYILDLLYFGQTSPERQTSIPLHERVPILELAVPSMPKGTDLADKLPTSPRIMKTHLPDQLIPKSFWEQNCRIIYVARNAKDSAVSFYHFDRMNMAQPEPGEWSSFLQRFIDGKMLFGSWYDHVTGWWERKHTHSKLLHVFYEDLVEDSGRELDRLCSFLGVSPSAEEKRGILFGTKFDRMKDNKMVNFSTLRILKQEVSPFIRKGKVGDWKNHFTVAQNEHFDEDYEQKMKNTTLQFRTEI
ncbi:cytosolic sulfotransferase 2-like [Genypterus blacodes]|uniref:cytosolic sulfotransferase 2-like n=1 Tax=Genypterus blacodes TaxID=154954 RepID=UPI003F7621B0